MHDLLNYLAAAIIVLGGLFSVVAAIGLIRLPDIYSRSHAASKAGTLGSGLVLVALALQAQDSATVTRAIAAIIFFILTAPIAAHLLARAAYIAGYRLSSQSVIDEMSDFHKVSDTKDN